MYLKTIDGADVGHIDLVARTVVAKAPDYEAALRECLVRWTADVATNASAPSPAAAAVEASAPRPPSFKTWLRTWQAPLLVQSETR